MEEGEAIAEEEAVVIVEGEEGEGEEGEGGEEDKATLLRETGIGSVLIQGRWCVMGEELIALYG